ncbi:NAD(P)-binding protein [Xylariaceae sp. FL0662B]|nr:NAD(P)-binding protein [Xylariaceae sp. FL0662B]
MADSYPFRNRVIAVTGASRGTGLAVARYLLVRGAKVSMMATSEANLAAALEGIEKDIPDVKDRVMTWPCDIRKAEDVKAWIEATVAKFGPLDGAANIAAKMQPKTWPITQLDVEDFRETLDINAAGLFNCLKAEMLNFKKEGGSIVNCGSILSKYSSPGVSAYSAAKHAMVGLTKVAAFEGGPKGIRVNIICPGCIDTDMIREPLIQPDGSTWVMPEDAIPAIVPRFAKPEEIAASIAFLLSDEAKMITKQEWYVDGGWNESNYVPQR